MEEDELKIAWRGEAGCVREENKVLRVQWGGIGDENKILKFWKCGWYK